MGRLQVRGACRIERRECDVFHIRMRGRNDKSVAPHSGGVIQVAENPSRPACLLLQLLFLTPKCAQCTCTVYVKLSHTTITRVQPPGLLAGVDIQTCDGTVITRPSSNRRHDLCGVSTLRQSRRKAPSTRQQSRRSKMGATLQLANSRAVGVAEEVTRTTL